MADEALSLIFALQMFRLWLGDFPILSILDSFQTLKNLSERAQDFRLEFRIFGPRLLHDPFEAAHSCHEVINAFLNPELPILKVAQTT